MSSPFVAEIRIVPFNFAPKGWAQCNGQLMAIQQNTALFSLIGIYYGGNGKSNFGLPDFQGRGPMHPGQGPGLSYHQLGEMGGTDNVTLQQSEMPQHTHTAMTGTLAATSGNPENKFWASAVTGRASVPMYAPTPGQVVMSPSALTVAGSSLPHNNMPPYLVLNFVIALQGVYPSRG
jgi:microcystin-dependent protein